MRFLFSLDCNHAWSIFLLIIGDVHSILSPFYDLWLNENYILKLSFFSRPPRTIGDLIRLRITNATKLRLFFYEPRRAVKKRKTPSLWTLRVLHHLIQFAVSQESGINNFERLLCHISFGFRVIFHRLEAGSCCNTRSENPRLAKETRSQDEEPSAWIKTAWSPSQENKSSSFLKQMNCQCFLWARGFLKGCWFAQTEDFLFDSLLPKPVPNTNCANQKQEIISPVIC